MAKLTKIHFREPTLSFVWKDMKVYGPFDIGEETEIDSNIAALLINRARAEKVENGKRLKLNRIRYSLHK
mgnify:FL=1